MFDLLESKLQLHQRLDILYVVDGYRATFSDWDGDRRLYQAHGKTILEALQKLQPMVEDYRRGKLASSSNTASSPSEQNQREGS
jgi:hypothetical protein